jgi:GAF domain-containing protein
VDDGRAEVTGGGTTASSGLSASFERLSLHADEWGPERVMCEGLDLVRDASWADECRLYAIRDDVAVEVAARPAPASPRDAGGVPLDWFPWGLAPVNPRRFVLVADARPLPSSANGDATLGQLGTASCLHLPILERQRPVGALHLYWAEPHLAWDDERGRLLRLLGRFLLGRCPA